VQIFQFLDGISPWWWVAFGVILGAVEMAAMSFFLIWPAIAAVLIGVMLAFTPAIAGEVQIAIFAVLAVAMTFAGRSLLHRFGDQGGPSDNLNSRATLMVGRHAEVQSFTGPEGAVTIDGIRWHAVWPAGGKAKPGATVKIVRADGMTLFVEPRL